MAISNYSELQAAIIDWSHRTDLNDKIPDFIRLGEDIIYGDLDIRQQEQITTLTATINSEIVALPTGFINAKSLSISSSIPNTPLNYFSVEEYQTHAQYDTSGEPSIYTIVANNLYLQPVPAAAYGLRLVYEGKIPTLSLAAPTNSLLTSYPTVYLYAALVQLAIYTKQDAGAWMTAYQKAISGINAMDWAKAGPLQIRHDINLRNIQP